MKTRTVTKVVEVDTRSPALARGGLDAIDRYLRHTIGVARREDVEWIGNDPRLSHIKLYKVKMRIPLTPKKWSKSMRIARRMKRLMEEE